MFHLYMKFQILNYIENKLKDIMWIVVSSKKNPYSEFRKWFRRGFNGKQTLNMHVEQIFMHFSESFKPPTD